MLKGVKSNPPPPPPPDDPNFNESEFYNAYDTYNSNVNSLSVHALNSKRSININNNRGSVFGVNSSSTRTIDSVPNNPNNGRNANVTNSNNSEQTDASSVTAMNNNNNRNNYNFNSNNPNLDKFSIIGLNNSKRNIFANENSKKRHSRRHHHRRHHHSSNNGNNNRRYTRSANKRPQIKFRSNATRSIKYGNNAGQENQTLTGKNPFFRI
jgi:hypothetical protein